MSKTNTIAVALLLLAGCSRTQSVAKNDHGKTTKKPAAPPKKIMSKTSMIAVTLLLLNGCNQSQPVAKKDHGQTVQKAAAPKKNVNQPVEDAMAQIPPKLRITFQDALQCEIKHNGKDKPAIQITPDYVRQLTARITANPSIAKC